MRRLIQAWEKFRESLLKHEHNGLRLISSRTPQNLRKKNRVWKTEDLSQLQCIAGKVSEERLWLFTVNYDSFVIIIRPIIINISDTY